MVVRGSGADSTDGYGWSGWTNRDGCRISTILLTRLEVRRARPLPGSPLPPSRRPWLATNRAGDVGIHGLGRDGQGRSRAGVDCHRSLAADLRKVP